MSSNWHSLSEDAQAAIARWALREAANILAEDAQLFAGKRENSHMANLTTPDALRLFAAVVRRIGLDVGWSSWTLDCARENLGTPGPPTDCAAFERVD